MRLFLLTPTACLALLLLAAVPLFAGGPFTVMTLNVGHALGQRETPETMAAAIRKANADVLLLQEVRPNRFGFKLLQVLDYPYRVGGDPDIRGASALHILSKYPLSRERTLIFAARTGLAAAVSAVAKVGGSDMLLCAVHLDPITKQRDESGKVTFAPLDLASTLFREMFDETSRSASVRELLTWLATEELPVIVGGDFNTIFMSRAVGLMEDAGYVDVLRGTSDYLEGTYKFIDFPIKPRVDFLFHSGTFEVQDAQVVDYPPGDHDGVAGTLFFPN